MAERRRAAKPARVSEVLATYLQRAGLADRVAQAGVVADWPAIVGPDVARVATAEVVTPDGVLLVRVRSSAWANELSLMTHQVIARLNAGRTTGRIERIRWMVGA